MRRTPVGLNVVGLLDGTKGLLVRIFPINMDKNW
jgi:hypothetical protein